MLNLRWYHYALWAGFILVMYLLPEFVSRGTLRTMIFANFLAMFAISWDTLSGRTGYVSFGHPFLIGIGAYTTAILTKRFDVAVELSIPIAVLVTMVGGLIRTFARIAYPRQLFCISDPCLYGITIPAGSGHPA